MTTWIVVIGVVLIVLVNWYAASKASKAASAAAKQTQEVANKLVRNQDNVARLAAENASTIGTQLREIHTLVNSDMTEARQDLLHATKVILAMYRNSVAKDEAEGKEALAEDLEAIEAAEARISQLQEVLADRLIQQQKLEYQQRVEVKR